MDFVSDTPVRETPEGAANLGYLTTPPTLGQAIGSQALSTVGAIGRWLNESLYEPQGIGAQIGRSIMQSSEIEGGVPPDDRVIGPNLASLPSPMLPAEEINKRYGPIGVDGKPVSITDQPMPEKLGQLIGQAKRDEIERANVWSRFAGAHSWPTNFAVGSLGFMLDPLNAATLFLPGLGEEAVLSGAARVGLPATGMAARLGARGVAGAVTGATAQLPISALKYGTGLEEHSDYGLREAFWDIAANAAMAAVLHAGIGTLTDVAARRSGVVAREAPPAEAAPEAFAPELRDAAEPVLAADAATKHQAMSSAVAQMVEGRPVDIKNFFPERDTGTTDIHGIAREVDPETFRQYDSLRDEREVSRQRLDQLGGGEEVTALERHIDELRGAALELRGAERRDHLNEIARLEEQRASLADMLASGRDTPEMAAIRARLQQLDYRMRDLIPQVSAAYREAEARMPRIVPPIMNVPDIAAEQQALHADGFASGVAPAELRAGMEEAYGGPPTEKVLTAAPSGIPFMITAAQRAELTARGHGAEEIRNMTPVQAQEILRAPARAAAEAEVEVAERPREVPVDHELAEVERQFAAIGEERLLPDEREELEQSAAAMMRAEGESRSLDAAAQCLSRMT